MPQKEPLPQVVLARSISAQEAAASHRLLAALEHGGIGDVRNVIRLTPDGLRRSTLLSASFDGRHLLRSPLMAAVRTGNYAIFSTVLKSINRLFRSGSAKRCHAIRNQMLERDKNGLTVAMHAARAGHVVVLETVLEEVLRSDALEALTAKDHRQLTLLMHAAATGNAAGFQEVMKSLETVLTEEQLADHMMLRSGDDRTLLMIAAASGDKMTFKVCAEAIRFAITPQNLRAMMEERDADGMTFLMHAANPNSRSNVAINTPPTFGTANASTPNANPFPNMRKKRLVLRKGNSAAPPARGPAESNSDMSGRHSKKIKASGENDTRVSEGARLLEMRVEGESYGAVSPRQTKSDDASTDGQDSSMSSSCSESVEGRSREHQEGAAGKTEADGHKQGKHQQQDEEKEQEKAFVSKDKSMDPRVPVLKAAVCLNKECLWKEQVREMLRAVDSWGRTLISHSILSGSPYMFEVAMEAIRADILDEEMKQLLEKENQSDERELLTVAKSAGGKEMETSVRKQINQLKRDVALRTKASTLEAKIQSFIPGKLIVMFQLLLPEVPRHGIAHERLMLLVAMSFIAPILAWASGLVERRVPSEDDFRPRRSFASYCLSAPAMFVWGIGTSTILEDDFHWPESRGAAVLAVGTIVIPSIDNFIGSKRVEQWSDKFCVSSGRFYRQAEIAWRKEKEIYKASRVGRTAGDAETFCNVGLLAMPTKEPVNLVVDTSRDEDSTKKEATTNDEEGELFKHSF